MVRVHPRYALEIDAELTTKSGVVTARTRNISIGGLCILLEPAPELDTPVSVKLALVFPDQELSEAITLQGTIVWCTKLNGRHQVGVKFVELNADTKHFLDLFIKYLEAGDQEDVPEPGSTT
jgi:hypothetical protein